MSKHDKKKYKDKENNLATGNQNEAKEKNPKRPAIIIAAVLVPILAVYLGGAAFFSKNFVPNTTFDGRDFSFKSPDLIAEAMEEDTSNRVITLKEIDGEEKISLHQDLDYVKTAEAPAEGWITGKTSWTWPKYLFVKNELEGEVNINYNKEKLNQAIDNLNAMNPDNIREPKDAYLGQNGDKYEIVPEDRGTEIIREKLLSALEDGIDNHVDEIDLVESDCYTKPKVLSDDPSLTETYEKYKSINFQKISIDMTGVTEILETPDIINLYSGNEPSKDKIREYARELAYQYDTYEEPRYFVNSYGYEMSVGTGADTYGFLLDVEGTTERLYSLMKEKKTADTTPVWTSTGWTRLENGSDIGGTYIEISIDDQRLWAYMGGDLVLSTDVVTGNYKKNDTPRGVFAILGKERDTHLKGQEALPNGKIDKWDSFVNFWMAINWSGVGLHNAPWRNAFGGTIYQGGGSHGCINMDYNSAQYLYNNYEYGTPVVVW